MARRRPASILVLGILNLVGGGLGLLCCTGCGGFLQVANANTDVLLKGKALPAPAPGPGGGGANFQQSANETAAVDLQLVKAVPSYRIYAYVNVLVSFLLDVLLLLSGIGLVLMAGWGRILALGYAGFSLFTKFLLALYLVVFVVGPANTIMDQQLAKNPRPGGEAFMFKAARLGRDLAWLVPGIYPVIVLSILLRPSVAQAFASAPERMDEEDEFPDSRRNDEEDDRRRPRTEEDDRFRER